ncbi:uncharacterized protein FOMMEDRAFT_161371 [Fomitiporia mediterranea MF3/22]|uniref:uncharacterized protein n=1 Tax=Fomitiporia mediterranea (strain MF3/22) TaxID=694068 RepID=UPI00044094F6|nr:uncharacterized protein FOMMEDRAFT_161371 [Fomitiporia mediterranea MF3/22]EJC98556.1 hypothetical protein FOMMEDRAFT_161371 [Fomitiporia mediterranea MF3/22]
MSVRTILYHLFSRFLTLHDLTDTITLPVDFKDGDPALIFETDQTHLRSLQVPSLMHNTFTGTLSDGSIITAALIASTFPLNTLASPTKASSLQTGTGTSSDSSSPSSTTGSGSSSSSGQGQFKNARFTFYDVGLGACGKTSKPSDFIVALNSQQFGSGYPGPNCFKEITISYGGKTHDATIMDECPGCPYGGLDFSRGLFDFFASEDKGVLTGEWSFKDGSGSSGSNSTSTGSSSGSGSSSHTGSVPETATGTGSGSGASATSPSGSKPDSGSSHSSATKTSDGKSTSPTSASGQGSGGCKTSSS